MNKCDERKITFRVSREVERIFTLDRYRYKGIKKAEYFNNIISKYIKNSIDECRNSPDFNRAIAVKTSKTILNNNLINKRAIISFRLSKENAENVFNILKKMDAKGQICNINQGDLNELISKILIEYASKYTISELCENLGIDADNEFDYIAFLNKTDEKKGW